jgi:Domain of unknown function (DUF4404)
MDPKTLRERLAKLHDELANAHRENPAARQSLGEILPQVKNLVDQPAGDASAADKSLPQRLERVAVQFEADHPKLAASARSLINLLSEVGI